VTTPPQPPASPLRRRRSIFPGLLLVVLGVVFLLHRWDPGLRIGHLARVYWPLLIVLWGVAKLIDHFAAQRTGKLRAPLLSPGEAVLLFLLALTLLFFGLGDWAHERVPWLRIDIPAFHDSYSESRTVAPEAIPAGAHVSVETANGNIWVHGISGNELRAGANESTSGESQRQADERMNHVEVVVEKTADGYTVHPLHQTDSGETVDVDLEVELPKTVRVTLRTDHGDISVADVGGSVDASTASGDIEIHDVGGDVAAQTEKGDVRIDQVAGSVTLKGRGADVEIADVKANVTLDGPFTGDTVVRKVAGATQVASLWAQLSISQLIGRLQMDSGELSLSDVDGPARIETHNKDIDAENIAGQLDIKDAHGDVKVVCAMPPREAINITNDSGDVELSLPARSSFQIGAYSRSGEVESDFESPSLRTTGEKKDGRLEGQFGGVSGAPAPKIILNTTYGTISVRKSS
jgi:DUF4097 and DUF4098 domain-containing protein YvlB